MKEIKGGITSPKGFEATGSSIGIKKNKKDLAIIKSTVPAIWAGAFTTNVVKAASVIRNMELAKQHNPISAIVINSGNANACTGADGMLGNTEMAKTLADCLKIDESSVLTASTGVIGAKFPIDIIKNGIVSSFPLLGTTLDDGSLAAESILTTDTYKKEVAVEIILNGKTVTIGAMAKGSGMIHPNMATLLGFITTDASITQSLLEKIIKESVQTTYNMVSVDGDTSTNDTIIIMANALAENEMIIEENADYNTLKDAIHFVNETLSKHLVRDGEGATKLICATVIGAKTKDDAKTIAKSVITSNLVKTAMFGQDANWGRVLCAMGYSGVIFDPNSVDIVFSSEKGNISLMKNGTPIAFDEAFALEILKEVEITVKMTLHEGIETATAWGSDLSYEYVKINGEYRS